MTILQYYQSFPTPYPWQSYTSATLDQKRRILAYALLLQQFPQNVTAPTAKALATYMQGWNEELQLDALAQSLAQTQGMGTSFDSAIATVNNAWNIPNGISDDATVQSLLWITELSKMGIAFPANVLPTPPAQ